MKQTLFSEWNFMRWLRMGLGILMATEAVQTNDPILGIVSAFFLFQAITNTGCCGTNGCEITTRKKNNDISDDTTFEEIKIK